VKTRKPYKHYEGNRTENEKKERKYMKPAISNEQLSKVKGGTIGTWYEEDKISFEKLGLNKLENALVQKWLDAMNYFDAACKQDLAGQAEDNILRKAAHYTASKAALAAGLVILPAGIFELWVAEDLQEFRTKSGFGNWLHDHRIL
jgi:hypothetical protein